MVCLFSRDLPTLGSVTIKVYRENYNKKKKERSDTDIGNFLLFISSRLSTSCLISSLCTGKIDIPAILLHNGQLHEEWSVTWSQVKPHHAYTSSCTYIIMYENILLCVYIIIHTVEPLFKDSPEIRTPL